MAAYDFAAGIALNGANLGHVGYVVPDMERALKRWLSSGAVLVVPPKLDPIQNVTCALLVLAGAVPVELVAPVEGGNNPVANRLSKGGGLDHVCIYVDNIHVSLAEQIASGAMCVVEPVYGAVFDRLIAFVITRPGMVLELMNRKPEGRLAQDPLVFGSIFRQSGKYR